MSLSHLAYLYRQTLYFWDFSATLPASSASCIHADLSGTNAAFSLLGDHGGAERKRHDLAVEQLSKAREDWNRERQQRLDYINKTLRDQRHAEQTFSDLGIAMREYHEVTGNQLPPLKEPRLSDFYNPSRQKKRHRDRACCWRDD